MKPTRRDMNRDATVVALYKGGATMEEIAVIQGGISRQRVQQLLQRNGVSGQHNIWRVEPLRVIAACRQPGIRNWHQAAVNLGGTLSGTDVRNVAYRLNMESVISRLFRLRRRAHRAARTDERRSHLVQQYRDLCQRIGRVATFNELNPSHGVPFFSEFLRYFPSIKDLRVAAGVDSKDKRGEWRRGRTLVRCKRGHLRAETCDKRGKCRECVKIRAKEHQYA